MNPALLLRLRARFTFLDGSPSASIRNDLALVTHLASQRDFRSRVGRRSRAFGLRPIDLRPLLPAAERVNALLGRVPGLFGACSIRAPAEETCRYATSLHPGPALTLGWSGRQPGKISGLPPPAPVLSCGSRTTALLISGAGTGDHIPSPASSFARIHDEPRILSPLPNPVVPRVPRICTTVGSDVPSQR